MKLNYGSVVDAIDVIDRWEELKTEKEALLEEVEELKEALNQLESISDSLSEDVYTETKNNLNFDLQSHYDSIYDWDARYRSELDALSEIENLDNRIGRSAILYREDYMIEYAKEWLEETYPEFSKSYFPYDCITVDYEEIANRLMADMSIVEIGSDTYYYRV